MSDIRKFSLAYDAAEDRIAWDGEDLQGATTRLWLTQRLSRRLVGALLPMLQPPDPAPSAAPPAPAREAAVQSWEQAAAMAGFGRVPGVRPRADTRVGLVHAVHLQPGPRGVRVTFESSPAGARSVDLAPAALRQMLAVTHRLYVTAEWPLDIWPAWIADPAGVRAPEALN